MNVFFQYAACTVCVFIKKFHKKNGKFISRRYLKTKKMTNVSQRRGGCKAESHRNPSGFQVILTMQPPVFVETVKIFDFSDTLY